MLVIPECLRISIGGTRPDWEVRRIQAPSFREAISEMPRFWHPVSMMLVARSVLGYNGRYVE